MESPSHILLMIPAKRVDFPSCEKVVKMIVKDLDNLGYSRVVFRCDTEPSILSLLEMLWKRRPLKVTRNPTVLQRGQ